MGLWSKVKKATKKIGKGTVNAWDDFTGKGQAEDAMKEQKKLYEAAIAQNAFTAPEYTTAQQTLMNDQVAGVAPTVTQAEVDKGMTSVLPQLNQNFAKNPWSTARLKATTNAQMQTRDAITQQKTAQQLGALDRLREEAANRANIKVGQAAQVQARPSGVQQIGQIVGVGNDVAKTGVNIAQMGAK